MLEPAGEGQPLVRASLRVAGASLAQHQLGVAIALHCQRVICLARGTSPELIALQHTAEQADQTFHIVATPQQLSALVTATDELIVFAEGLFVDAGEAEPLLASGQPVVLTLPDDGAVGEGFERLDINHAAAGLMKVPGSLVERLHELPSDFDAGSALTRIALQAGVQTRAVPASARAGVGWKMVRSEAEALAVENEWLRGHFCVEPRAAPARRLARAAVLSFGPSLLHHGNASVAAALGVLAALVLALGCAWFGAVVPALLLIAFSWVLVEGGAMLRSAERQAHGVLAPAIPRSEALGWLVDLALIFILVAPPSAMLFESAVPFGYRLFPPLILILQAHLVPPLLASRAAAWVSDRTVLALILLLAGLLGYLSAAVCLLAVAIALAGIVLPPKRSD